MKRLLALVLVFMMLVPTVCAEKSETTPRILVAYLSRAGENYNVGTVKEV